MPSQFISLSLLLVATTAFADLGISHATLRLPSPTASNDCLDLNGSWKGTCVDLDGKTYPDQNAMQQSQCNTLQIGGLGVPVYLGGETETRYLLPQATGPSAMASTNSVSSSWADSQQTLNVRLIMTGKTVGGEGADRITVLTQEYKMVGKQLQVIWRNYDGMATRGATCKMDKI